MAIPQKRLASVLVGAVAVAVSLALASSTFNPFQTTPADWEVNDPGVSCDAHAGANIEVLVAGVPLTGSSSMQHLLQKLGYETMHWQSYMTRYFEFMSHFYTGAIVDPDVQKVFQDIPGKGALLDPVVPALFDSLRCAYPNAKVILTTKEASSWLQSYESYVAHTWLYHWTRSPVLFLLSHVSRALRLGSILRCLSLLPPPSGLDLDHLPELSAAFRKSDELIFGSWQPTRFHIKKRQLYEEHVKATVPAERLLILDDSAGDALGKLAHFLNVSASSAGREHFNAVSSSSPPIQAEVLRGNVLMMVAAAGSLLLLMLAALLFLSPDLWLALDSWARLVASYGGVRQVYIDRCSQGHFEYGCPASSFSALHEHTGFLELLGLRTHPGKSSVEFLSDFSVIPSYLPIDQAAAACLGAVGLAVADFMEIRGGSAQKVRVRQSDAGAVTAGYLHLRVSPDKNYKGCEGFRATIEAESRVNPVRRPYPCRDGGFVFVHGGLPKLKQGILDFFGCDCDVESIQAKTQQKNAPELEKAMQAAGLAVTQCRTPQEWRQTEQYRRTSSLPVVLVEPVPSGNGNREPRCLESSPTRPLSGVVVLDFTHIIASPVVGRTLAEHGALVIKVVYSERPRRPCFDEETNHGKVPLHINLQAKGDRQRLWDLVAAADIFIDGYTEGVLERQGFGKDALQACNPNLIYVDVTCYGHVGPLASCKGFQQNANFATGVAVVADEQFLAYQLLSQVDYATGFMGAYGAILALCHRARTGQASRVYVSLCQTASWMSLFGAEMPSFPDFFLRATRLLFGLSNHVVKVGNLQHIRPAVQLSDTAPERVVGFSRWWNDEEGQKNDKGERAGLLKPLLG